MSEGPCERSLNEKRDFFHGLRGFRHHPRIQLKVMPHPRELAVHHRDTSFRERRREASGIIAQDFFRGPMNERPRQSVKIRIQRGHQGVLGGAASKIGGGT